MGSYNIKKNCRQSLIQKKWMCVSYLKHFTKQPYIKFRGYKGYHTIHPETSARGGSAVIINENIHHHEETKYETGNTGYGRTHKGCELLNSCGGDILPP